MRFRGLAKAACFVLLSSGPLLVSIAASERGEAAANADESASQSYFGTVLEWKDGSLTLKRESGEVEILSLDDSGLNLRVDRDVVKGSRVKVTEEKTTSTSRTLTVQLAPAS
jgi:hypothetical protein